MVLIGEHLQHGWHQVKDTSLLGSCHTCKATIEVVPVLFPGKSIGLKHTVMGKSIKN